MFWQETSQNENESIIWYRLKSGNSRRNASTRKHCQYMQNERIWIKHLFMAWREWRAWRSQGVRQLSGRGEDGGGHGGLQVGDTVGRQGQVGSEAPGWPKSQGLDIGIRNASCAAGSVLAFGSADWWTARKRPGAWHSTETVDWSPDFLGRTLVLGDCEAWRRAGVTFLYNKGDDNEQSDQFVARYVWKLELIPAARKLLPTSSPLQNMQ